MIPTTLARAVINESLHECALLSRVIPVTTPDTIATPPTTRTSLDAEGKARANTIRATPTATTTNGL
jgi:hypothetical protein